MTEKSKGGRPKHGEAAKRSPMNMRTTPQLRERIEEAASVFGYSLTQEVERRLISSFVFDDTYGGIHNNTLVSLLGSTIRAIEEERGANWREDDATWYAVKAAADRLLRWHRPKSKADDQLNALIAESEASRAALDQCTQALDDFRTSVGIISVRGVAFDSPTKQPAPTGMFGGGLAQYLNPRAKMTEEQVQEEAKLEFAVQEARERDKVANEALMSRIRPKVAQIEEAQAEGERHAEDQLIGLGLLPS